MSQLQDIVRILLAAGAHVDPQQGRGVRLLYVGSEDGTLMSQLWTGDRFDEKELIADSARLNSTAAYLFTPTDRSVLYVSPSSTLGVARYSEDEEEWVSDDSIPQFQVDPDGKVTAAGSSGGLGHVFFQNRSKQLVHLDEAWTPTVLPVNPVNGTPLLAMVVEGQMHLYYVSASDNRMHCVFQQQDSGWTDNSLPYPFEMKLRQFVMVTEGSGTLVPVALTEQNQLLWFKADGSRTILGSVNDAGTFVASSSEENVFGFQCAGCRGIRCPLFDFTHLRVISPETLKENEANCGGN
ncbi:hypothetical protein F5887DRAFT_178472 [Amanita rubescens]|nr:hypothetical protein F5887DRAFT_448380 [Amanita rubescens]KAF8345325.1 hypothetical protein F5887DRAFT_178472 [Amanita rubescens]